MAKMSGSAAYRIAASLAVATALLEVWMNLAVGMVGSPDNPVNQGFYGVVVAAGACAFVAQLRPDGMARAMLAVAGIQLLLGLAVATAPSISQDPMGATGVVMISGFFAAVWLASAAFFQRSARLDANPDVRPA